MYRFECGRSVNGFVSPSCAARKRVSDQTNYQRVHKKCLYAVTGPQLPYAGRYDSACFLCKVAKLRTIAIAVHSVDQAMRCDDIP